MSLDEMREAEGMSPGWEAAKEAGKLPDASDTLSEVEKAAYAETERHSEAAVEALLPGFRERAARHEAVHARAEQLQRDRASEFISHAFFSGVGETEKAIVHYQRRLTDMDGPARVHCARILSKLLDAATEGWEQIVADVEAQRAVSGKRTAQPETPPEGQ